MVLNFTMTEYAKIINSLFSAGAQKRHQDPNDPSKYHFFFSTTKLQPVTVTLRDIRMPNRFIQHKLDQLEGTDE